MADHGGVADGFCVDIQVRKHNRLRSAGGASRVHNYGKILPRALFVVVALVKVGIGDEILPEDNSGIICGELDLFDMQELIEALLEETETVRRADDNDTLKRSNIAQAIDFIKNSVDN